MITLTPKEVVQELDRFVIGQQEAKRALAIALRNRWRRKQVEGEIKEEIVPHNILMVGPTGVGKTELARRLARVMSAPFLKVEATKFTEVGYVGRDVDSIIRDLVEISVNIVRKEEQEKVKEQAHVKTQAIIVDAIAGENASQDTKESFLKKLNEGHLDNTELEVMLKDKPANPKMPMMDIPGMPGAGQIGMLNVGELLSNAMGGEKRSRKKLKIKEAYDRIFKEECDNLTDEEDIIEKAISRAEMDGVVFIDEIDKIAAAGKSRGEISREGVQRDLLPLIEGTTVTTKYGPVKSDHMLFIASGAFHVSKPSDMLPELQGRLPIRVHLNPLTKEDMINILSEPEYSLIKQYQALLKVEGLNVIFTKDAIDKIAYIAEFVNSNVENIGARRLSTIMEKLLEDINFNASEASGVKLKVDVPYVEKYLNDMIKEKDMSKFLL